MECVICKHGSTKQGFTTVILSKKNSIVIFKNVPAEICENCGEYFLSSEISKKIFCLAEEAIKKGVEIEIIRFAA